MASPAARWRVSFFRRCEIAEAKGPGSLGPPKTLLPWAVRASFLERYSMERAFISSALEYPRSPLSDTGSLRTGYRRWPSSAASPRAV